jgi:hypothetical protein
MTITSLEVLGVEIMIIVVILAWTAWRNSRRK